MSPSQQAMQLRDALPFLTRTLAGIGTDLSSCFPVLSLPVGSDPVAALAMAPASREQLLCLVQAFFAAETGGMVEQADIEGPLRESGLDDVCSLSEIAHSQLRRWGFHRVSSDGDVVISKTPSEREAFEALLWVVLQFGLLEIAARTLLDGMVSDLLAHFQSAAGTTLGTSTEHSWRAPAAEAETSSWKDRLMSVVAAFSQSQSSWRRPQVEAEECVASLTRLRKRLGHSVSMEELLVLRAAVLGYFPSAMYASVEELLADFERRVAAVVDSVRAFQAIPQVEAALVRLLDRFRVFAPSTNLQVMPCRRTAPSAGRRVAFYRSFIQTAPGAAAKPSPLRMQVLPAERERVAAELERLQTLRDRHRSFLEMVLTLLEKGGLADAVFVPL